VSARRGTIPVVLTAPHGGEEAVPGVPPRKSGTRTTDVNTLRLTEAIEAELTASGAGTPYVVAARFSRKFIDANRDEHEALEDRAARPVYAAYHARVREFIAEIRAKFPAGGLLLDIHGQSTEPDTIVRGTQDGTTVPDLLKRHGAAALVGPNSVLGALAASGYTVFPTYPPPNPKEMRAYNGGFTVVTYGSHQRGGIDAIQLEFGVNVRRRPSLAKDVAAAIARFHATYLAAPR
jgi:N-formylglutamate amidohydrolase